MSDLQPVVFVVDDDASVRRSTERLVKTRGFAVRTFASAREFLDEASDIGLGCLVLDVHLPGLSGLDLQTELARAGVALPIIFITGAGTIPMSVQAMKAGAVEFLTKPVKSNTLVAAIEAAIAQARAAHETRAQLDALRHRLQRLTPRERQVLTLVVRGRSNKEIAVALDTTERTVKFHRGHLMEKMEADSVAQLVRMAERLGDEATAE